MIEVLIHFYKTEYDLRGDSIPFLLQLRLDNLPEEQSVFHYSEIMFKSMSIEEQKDFVENFGFKHGYYLVIKILEYDKQRSGIDYAMYLSSQIDDGKSAFINLTDSPEN